MGAEHPSRTMADAVATFALIPEVIAFSFVAGAIRRSVCSRPSCSDLRTYRVAGQVFFASADVFVDAFDTLDTENRPVRIDLTQAHFWDVTAVAALDKVVQRLQKHGSTIEVIGLNDASAVLVDRLGLQK